MKSVPCIFLFLFLFCVSACGRSSNSIQIGGNTGDGSAIRLTKGSLYISPALLGLEQREDITINTSSSNEITFDVSKEAEVSGRQSTGKSF